MVDFSRRVMHLFSAALFLAAACATPFAMAKTPEKLSPPVIAVVDVQRILDESFAAQSVQKQLESHRAKFQAAISKEENELRKAEQDLNKSRDQLKPDAYSDREQLLRQRFLTVERHVQSRRKVLDQAFSDSMNAVRDGLLKVVNEIARQHGANIVLTKQQMVWSDPSFDLTDEVLAQLNDKLPQVTVKMPPEDKSDETLKPPSP
ncbi:MAG: OmpH family outer membrane protein [Bdellovibrionales bacterium]